MKYLDMLDLVEGYNYKFYNDFHGIWYPTFDQCLSNIHEKSNDLDVGYTNMYCIGVFNTSVAEEMDYKYAQKHLVRPNMTFKDAVIDLRKAACNRFIYLSLDLSRIYMEHFSVAGTDFFIDYDILFGDAPIIEAHREVKTSYPLLNNHKCYIYRNLGSLYSEQSVYSSKEELFNLPYEDILMPLALCHSVEYMDYEDPVYIPTALITEVL